tara:strand:- start:1311 stop:1670 length:360 start_codon:yes stop_codon:yes gene_type:complete
MIIEGDGSWGKAIEDGRCPRCEARVTISGESQARCTSCGLMIGYNSAKEESMLTESEATPIEEMDWSDAVQLIEGVVNEEIAWLESQNKVRCKMEGVKNSPEGDRAMKVALAWHRILRG